jgi:putative membrane protein
VRTIILLTLMLAAVTFAVQNADRVAVDVLFWRLDASLAIVIALCLTAGVLVGVLLCVPRIYRMRADHRRLRAQLAGLDDSGTSQANQTQFRSPQQL